MITLGTNPQVAGRPDVPPEEPHPAAFADFEAGIAAVREMQEETYHAREARKHEEAQNQDAGQGGGEELI